MRKLYRSIARHNMKKAGMTGFNKRRTGINKLGQPVRLPSAFSQCWREYAGIKPARA